MVSVQDCIFCHGQAAHLPSRDKAGRTAAAARTTTTAAAAKATNMPRDKAGREGGRREGDKDEGRQDCETAAAKFSAIRIPYIEK